MKRSALTRRTPLRQYAQVEAEVRAKTCAHCGKPFIPSAFMPMQMVCAKVRCAKGYATAVRLAKAKAEKEQDRATRERLKKPNQLKSEAQDAFNDYIRYRDQAWGLPCVSCGVENPPMTTGGQWDAGHFLSRGSHPELAFDEDNCWRQCKSCNAGSGRFKHKERVVSERYEEELTRRIGAEQVAGLRGPHPPVKRTKDDFRALRDLYRARLRALKAQEE